MLVLTAVFVGLAWWGTWLPLQRHAAACVLPSISKGDHSAAGHSWQVGRREPASSERSVDADRSGPNCAEAAALESADLRIQVLTAELLPSARALVYVQPTHSHKTTVVTCNDLGIAILRRLDVGRVAVRGIASGQTVVLLHSGMNDCELVLTHGVDILVEVVDAGGQPVTQASVHITDPRDRNACACVGATDALGRYIIRAVEQDRCVFVARFGSEQSATYPLIPPFLGPDRRLRIQLAPGGVQLSGTVIARETEHPVPNALVRVFGLRQQVVTPATGSGALVLGAASVRLTSTDAKGRFALAGCCELPLRVEAWAPGFALADMIVDGRPGCHEKDVQIRLSPGAEFNGFVIDHAGMPVSGAIVRLLSRKAAAVSRPIVTATNDYGGFRFEDLGDGGYHVRVSAIGGRHVETQFGVPVADPVRIQLRPSPRPSGCLVDVDEAPLAYWNVGWSAGPLVAEEGAFPRQVTASDGEGRFWLPEEIEPDGWLYAWPPGQATMPMIHAPRRGTEYVELHGIVPMRGLGSILLKSSEWNGQQQQLVVKLIDSHSGLGVLRSVFCGQDVTFHGLSSGVYYLHWQVDGGYWMDAGMIALCAGETQEVSLPACNLIGKRPVAGR